MKKFHLLFFAIYFAALNFSYSQKQFWGTTSQGGTSVNPTSKGVIFKTDSNGNNPEIKYVFHQDETNPEYTRLIQASNGKLYGMTSAGGKFGKGAIFEFDPATNAYLKIYDFAPGTGSEPYGSLTQAANGKLYGTTTAGGANGNGVLFEFDIATKIYTKKYDFGTSQGKCYSGIIQVTADKYYGLTDGGGIIFEFNVTTGIFAVKHTIGITTSQSGLLKASNGKIYGVTSSDGLNNMGTIFEYDTAGIFTKLFDFDGTNSGTNDYIGGGLIQLPTGKLYGMTYSGGANNAGVLFEYNISTAIFTKKIDFDGANNGSYPRGSLMLASNSKIYGMTSGGGVSGAGVLFDYNATTNTLTKKIDLYTNFGGGSPHGSLMQAGNGKIYGTVTSATDPQSWNTTVPCLFEYTIASNTTVKLHFFGKYSKGGDGTYGGGPYSSLIHATNGMFYGTTFYGGIYRDGVLFEYNPNNDTLTVKVNFDGSNLGDMPLGLIQASNGKLYGMTSGGNVKSVFFEYDIATNICTPRFDFSGGTNGTAPRGNVVQASDGKLYGTASGGGANSYGTIFCYNPSDSSFSKIHDFNSTNGSSPNGSLVQAPNGKLYGTTYTGGANSFGVIFEFNPADSTYAKLFDFESTFPGGSGIRPYCGLMLAGNGMLYGTNTEYGLNNSGTLFEFNPGTNTFTKKFDFDGTSGNNSYSALIQAGNGKLYGTRNSGGTNGNGTFFEYDISTSTFTKKMDFSDAFGAFPQYSNVIEIGCILPQSTVTVFSDTVCSGSTGVVYSVSSQPGTTYTFDYFGFDAVVNSNGSNAATIDFLSTATDGTVEITATNYCGSTVVADINVVVTTYSVSATKTDATCNGCSDGTATTSVSGGTYPYSYIWSNAATTASISGLVAGTYSVTVTSNNGCSGTVAVTVTEPPPCNINSVFTSNSPQCVGSPTNFTNDSCGYCSYSWDFDDGNTSTLINPTHIYSASGTYSVTLIVNDTNGCADAAMVTVTVNPLPTATITPAGPTSFCQGSDSVDLTANNAVAYLWYNGDTTNKITVGNSGSFSVTVTDANGCSAASASTTVTVFANPAISISSTDATCMGCNDGTASAIVSGGASPYSYLWNTGVQTQNIASLSPAIYTVTVTDANGCTATDSITISQPSCNLSIASTSSTNVSCNGGNNGTASVIVTGGFPPYFYLWNNGQVNSTATGLGAGTYSVTVSDSAGCSDISAIAITQPIAVTVIVTSTNPACGTSTGSATASVAGGVSPYSFQWTNGDLTATADSLPSGLFLVTVTDGNGCAKSALTTLSDAGAPVITITSTTDVNCAGGNNGAINISVSGGTTPYSYLWSNGATTEDISALFAGPFEVEVSGNNGCKSTKSIAVSEPAALSASFNTTDAACGNADGSITVVPAGGTSPYSYSWSNGGTGTTQSNLAAGVFSITITDDKGCVHSAQAAVTETGAATVTVDSIVSAGCNGAGSIYITATGGSTPYSYSWTNSTTNEDLAGVSAGNYGLFVTSGNGCISVITANIPSITPVADPVCLITVDTLTGTNKIVWQKTIGSGIAAYKIYRETTQAGVYQVVGTVPYDNLSTFTDPVANPLIHSWRYKISAVDSCGNESAQSSEHKTMHITINIGLSNSINLIWDQYQGFSYPTYYIYRYKPQTGWTLLDSLASNLNSYTDYTPPTFYGLRYLVEARHPDGCVASKSVENHNSSRSNRSSSAQPAPVDLSAISTVTDATQDSCDGDAGVTANGGITPYTYLWNTIPAQTTATATGLCAGDYEVTVTDTEGDSVVLTVTVGIAITTNENSAMMHYRFFPNPVKNEMNFSVVLSSEQMVKITMINTLGQETQLFNNKIETGEYNLKFDTENLATGIYFLRLVFGENKPEYLKFVKSR